VSYFCGSDFTLSIKQNKLNLRELNHLIIGDNSTSNASSHWMKYLELINIEIVSTSKAFIISINQQGIANLIKLNLKNILVNLPSLILNLFLYFKFSRNLHIFVKLIQISIRTKRLICFDMIKHGILVDKTKFLIKMGNVKDIVIIGDGYGFLGILLKALNPNVNICYVNLEKNLFLDILFYKVYFGNKNEPPKIIDAGSFHRFSSEYTLFFNVASFAEMTESQVTCYLEGVKMNKGLLVSLNRQGKMHPNGEYLDFNFLLDRFSPAYLVNEENVEWYSKFPSNKFRPSWLPFDGPVDLKIFKFN
jgi:hypothetical protein